jgi:hypothetical protein
VALELVLARTGKVAICVTRLAVYPIGFEFDLMTISAGGFDDELNSMMFGHPHRARRHSETEGLPPSCWRIGVHFGDGAKATNQDRHHRC